MHNYVILCHSFLSCYYLQDRQVLKEIQREATVKRGYPLAALLGGLSYVAIGKRFPKMNIIGRIGLSTFAGNSFGCL